MVDHSEVDEARMSFVEHLRELRVRLRYSVISLALGLGVAGIFYEQIFAVLALPVGEALQELKQHNPGVELKLVFTSPTDAFWAYFSVALYAGIFISSPVIFLQIWKFIAPGLYKNERRYGLAFAGSSAVLFTAGAVFCYFLVLPVVLEFLLGLSSTEIVELKDGTKVSLEPLLTMTELLRFTRKLMLGFGLVFELPLLILFLSLTGAVTHRGLWKFNRWWIVISFVLSAALTPPDVLSQSMMAGPLIVLYNVSILIAYVITVRREARQRALEQSWRDDDAGGGD